jgi:hypothetical protein
LSVCGKFSAAFSYIAFHQKAVFLELAFAINFIERIRRRWELTEYAESSEAD